MSSSRSISQLAFLPISGAPLHETPSLLLRLITTEAKQASLGMIRDSLEELYGLGDALQLELAQLDHLEPFGEMLRTKSSPTKTCPAPACDAIRAAMFTVRPK
jgi:hypothetical protein